MEKILRGKSVWVIPLESSIAAQCVGEFMPRYPNQIELIRYRTVIWIVGPVKCRVKYDSAINFISVAGKESPGFLQSRSNIVAATALGSLVGR